MAITRQFSADAAFMASKALDLTTRLGIGQFDYLADLSWTSYLMKYDRDHCALAGLSDREFSDFRRYSQAIGNILEYTSGASYGIHSEHVSLTAKRAWELHKVLDQALAYARNPKPEGFRTVDYDGVVVRNTRDPLPVAEHHPDSDTPFQLTLIPEQLRVLNESVNDMLDMCRGEFGFLSRKLANGDIIPNIRSRLTGDLDTSKLRPSDDQIKAVQDSENALASVLAIPKGLTPEELVDLAQGERFLAALVAASETIQGGLSASSPEDVPRV